MSQDPSPYIFTDATLPDLDLDTSSHPIRETIQLESADPVTLFNALSAVERALPEMLRSLKPVLASLSRGDGEAGRQAQRDRGLGRDLPPRKGDLEKEEEGDPAGRGIVDFLAILDDIQDTLRQTALYLKTTKASPSTLVPPPVGAIPTPFASTLPRDTTTTTQPKEASQTSAGAGEDGSGDAQDVNGGERNSGPDLGLYASRIESRTLGEMVDVLKRIGEETRRAGGRERDAGAAGRGGLDGGVGDADVDEDMV